MEFIDNFIDSLDWGRVSDLLTYDSSSPMIFSSGLFFFAFLLFLPIYGLLRQNKFLRIVYVALFSLFFYYKSSGLYVFLLLFAATSDFIIGLMMEKEPHKNRRRRYVIASMCINLGVLAYFKYFNFLGSLFFDALNTLGAAVIRPDWTVGEWNNWDIVLPAGISFYTFQTMSYIIDLYRGEIKPLRRWIDYVFYVSFFPQLVAGPIVRAKDFIPQINRKPSLSKAEYGEALALIISGLFKKAIISDYISLNFVDRIFDAPSLYTGLENLLGVYGYALQIYCDFSGYSDMAIGIALLLGFRFNINFDSPYQSASITEFWRRWHISLSTWLRDYLYIPLGGNRKGKLRTYINLMITMLLGGLWHGAALRFILWGALHGLALALHKLWSSLVPSSTRNADELPKWRRWMGRLITFHLVCFAWIFFRADSMEIARDVIHQIYTNFHPEVFFQFVAGYKLVFVLMVVGYLLHFTSHRSERRFRLFFTRAKFSWQVAIILLLIVVIIQMRSAEIQPFIYFQF
ncbi:MBOAT family O-acyltransferase [Porphyromonas circumdentaria]|uniref:D-alanyl-lipoteichoic acid acyltransferase DltB, MBOAT superfamily n=1 Tax=Porphyromonas circumdentaria TaxID=29524 RepID=A0A1T4P5U2_9PORP|nr:MBOAT family protein [Porphyromonas circumdentaria]MBB6276313.1 D-alanyl-lipoteichoic acid acyltransferase DltB (MBOAT superfamily) [Porphyromonas circumdentaria]SJZ86616.1 D-alanyl-lipoteichoic acid acyltransferase DltB, MBOAT superfamily [Porphyromonas circumdentaria]